MTNLFRNLFPPPALLCGIGLSILLWPTEKLNFSSLTTGPFPIEIPPDAPRDSVTLLDVTNPTPLEIDLRSIAEKSLFLEERRPWSPEVEGAPDDPVALIPTVPPPPEPELLPWPEIVFLGYFDNGFQPRALVIEQSSGDESWVTTGDMIGIWIIEKIDPKTIFLNYAGSEYQVQLAPTE